jgi:hypothetical protein
MLLLVLLTATIGLVHTTFMHERTPALWQCQLSARLTRMLSS